jgi:hypothetical protein
VAVRVRASKVGSREGGKDKGEIEGISRRWIIADPTVGRHDPRDIDLDLSGHTTQNLKT